MWEFISFNFLANLSEKVLLEKKCFSGVLLLMKINEKMNIPIEIKRYIIVTGAKLQQHGRSKAELK